MRRMPELVDGGDALDFVAALDQDARIAGKGRDIAGHRDHDGALCSPLAFRPALARPAAADRTPPHRSPAILPRPADGETGRALPQRTGFNPLVDATAFCNLQSHLHHCRSPTPVISQRGEARTDRRRKTDRRGVWRVGKFATSAANVSSPATVAWRKEPGGRITRALPMVTPGGWRISTSSPCRVNRARACLAAMSDNAVPRQPASGPEPLTSTSRPLSVAVIWMSSGLPIPVRGSASAQAASNAPFRPGSRIGQRSIGKHHANEPRQSRP